MLKNANKKRLLALAITATMITGMLPVSAFSADDMTEEPAQSVTEDTALVEPPRGDPC